MLTILLELTLGKKETEPLVQTEKHQTQNKETHGLRDDIDANTPINDVKGPNVFERVKEEFEAITVSIHSRDKNQDSPSSIQGYVVSSTLFSIYHLSKPMSGLLFWSL